MPAFSPFAPGDKADALIILAILLVSGLLGFWQERGATNAVAKLLAIVQIKATVRRQGEPQEIPVEEIVPGDVVLLLPPGTLSPATASSWSPRTCSWTRRPSPGVPVEKSAAVLAADTPLAQRTNTLFMGTHVVSGTAVAVVVLTGSATEFGQVSAQLKLRPPETEFERGVRHFGYLLMEVTMLLVITIFAINVDPGPAGPGGLSLLLGPGGGADAAAAAGHYQHQSWPWAPSAWPGKR